MIKPIENSCLRSLAWRLGRFFYRWARREGANDPRTNGEYWLLSQIIQQASADTPVFLDIGANVGDWSAQAVEQLQHQGKRGILHSFEPTSSTFQHLTQRFESESAVATHHLALSDHAGNSDFYVMGALAGRNSLHPEKGATHETVPLQTLDAFLQEAGIAHVTMIKSDTEGHDLSILQGAKQSLMDGCFDVWQFEYNHRWVANRATLKGVFDLIQNTPYTLGKLYGNGIELYDEWHMELDRFIETNYVLVRKSYSLEGMIKMQFDESNIPRNKRINGAQG